MPEKNKYFTQSDWHSSYLPPITWEESVTEHKILTPSVLLRVLDDAREFLVTAEGPHLTDRQESVPEWFRFWRDMLLPLGQIIEDLAGGQFAYHPGVMPYTDVAKFVKARGGAAGSQNMGGGEGTEGHLSSYYYMRKVLGKNGQVIWAYERDSYFNRFKERGGPFLPLPVRLTMAVMLGVNVATVYPDVPEGVTGENLSLHYLNLFRTLGAAYSFADSTDPHALEKIARGRMDRPTLIPHLDVPSTRRRVLKLHDPDQTIRIHPHREQFAGTEEDEAAILARLDLRALSPSYSAVLGEMCHVI